MRAQAEWNVDTHMRWATGPTSSPTRSFISPAALLVNVIASSANGDERWSPISHATRLVSTRVLPDPAPATTSSGTSGGAVTASRCTGLRPASRSVPVSEELSAAAPMTPASVSAAGQISVLGSRLSSPVTPSWAGTLSRHARSSRVRSSFNATVNAPVSLSTSSAKYGSQSLSSDGEFVSVPLGTRRKRIRSASKSQMLWVDSIRSIRATARGGRKRVLRIAAACPRQRQAKPNIPSVLDEERDGTVIDQLDLHSGCKLPGGDGCSEIAEGLRERGDETFGLLGGRGGRPRRAPAAPGVAVERELADDEGGAADRAEWRVHHPVGVVEDAEVPHLLGQLAGDGLGVVVRHADEHAQARADLADNIGTDAHTGLGHALHERPHHNAAVNRRTTPWLPRTPSAPAGVRWRPTRRLRRRALPSRSSRDPSGGRRRRPPARPRSHDRTRCGSGRTSGAPARTRRRASSSLPRGSSPSGSALHIGRVLAEAGDAVHLGSVREGALGRIAVGGVALPCLLRGGL